MHKLIIIKHDTREKSLIDKIKTGTFRFFSSVNDGRAISWFIGSTLLLLSFMQLGSLMKFHLSNEPIDEYSSVRVLSMIVNYPIYFQKENLEQKIHDNILIIIYTYSVALILLIILCLYYVLYDNTNFTLPFSILLYLFQFTQWILYIPFLIILVQMDFKEKVAVSIINIILIIFYILLAFSLFYLNILGSINVKDFFRVNSNTCFVNHFTLQITVFVLSAIIDKSKTYLFIAYIGIFILLGKITYNLLSTFMFYQKQFVVSYVILISYLYEQLMSSIINKYTLNKYNSIYKTYGTSSIFVICLSYTVVNQIFVKYMVNYSSAHPHWKIKTYKQFILMISSLTYIFNNTQEVDNVVKKNGVLCRHLKTCKEPVCALRQKKLYVPLGEAYSQDDSECYDDNVRILHVIKEVYKKYYFNYHMNFNFCLSYILFILFHFGNYELALTEIDITSKLNISLSQEFILFLLKDYANTRIVQCSENFVHDDNVSWGILSLMDVLNYDKLSYEIKHNVFLGMDNKRELWRLFENDDVIIEDLYDIGDKFFKAKNSLTGLWKKICEISNDNPDNEITNLYCDFLDKVCNDPVESEIIFENKKFDFPRTSDELFNFRYSNDTGVVMIESNCGINTGKITYINQSLVSLLGYNNKNELIGNNIKMMIPGEIGRYHDEIIKNYFEKGRSDILKKTQSYLCVKTKEKYLLPVYLLISILPNFGKNMEGVGIIRERPKAGEVVICNHAGVIEACTIKLAQLLNITPNLIERSTYYIQTYFTELMKPDRTGMPHFLLDEFFEQDKKDKEIKLQISCPKYNLLDSKKYQVKTRNVFINLSQGKFSESILKSFGLIPGEKTNYKNFVDSIKHVIQGKKEEKEVAHKPGKKHEKGVKNILLKRTLSRKASRRSKAENSYQEQKSPDIDIVKQYKQISKRKYKSLSRTYKSNPLISKLDEIYSSMIMFNELHSLTEKAPVNLTHKGIKIFNGTIPVRIITIPTENLMEERVEDDFYSVLSDNDGNHGNEGQHRRKKKDDIIKVSGFNNSFNKQSNFGGHGEKINNSILLEVGSENGSEGQVDLTVYQHVEEESKKTKFMKYRVHCITGLLMCLSIILVALCVIFVSNDFYLFSMKHFEILHESFQLLNLFLDIGKYATLLNVKSIFYIDGFRYYPLDLKELLLKRIQEVLKVFPTFFHRIDGLIAGNNKITVLFADFKREYFVGNQLIDLSFVNSFFDVLDSALLETKTSLRMIRHNLISIHETLFSLLKNYLYKEFNRRSKFFFYFNIAMLIFGIVVISTLIMVLFFSYLTRKKEQIKQLSIYEKLNNEDVQKVLKRIEKFEKRHKTSFDCLSEFKKKKIQLNTKSSILLNELTRKRMIEKQKKSIKVYNILETKKILTEKEEQTKKNLISREDSSFKYLFSFIFIYIFTAIFTSVYIYEVVHYYNIITKSNIIIQNLYISEFLLNYEIVKLDTTVSRNYYLISNVSDTEFNYFFNRTHKQFNDLAVLIIQNQNLFEKSIQEILSGDLCSIGKFSLGLCEVEEFQYTQRKGIRSLIAYYLNNIYEANVYFINHYSDINSVKMIFHNSIFCVGRFLMEDILIVFEEIFKQLYDNVEKKSKNVIIILVFFGIGFGAAFLFIVIYRLTKMVKQVKDEEILWGRLVQEI